MISAKVTSVGNVAKESFSVRYHGALDAPAIEARLREKVHDVLHLSKLLPGDSFLTSEVHALRPAAPPSPGSAPAPAVADREEPLLGVINLRSLGAALATLDSAGGEHSGGEVADTTGGNNAVRLDKGAVDYTSDELQVEEPPARAPAQEQEQARRRDEL